MTRSTLIKLCAVALGFVVLLGVILPVYNTVQITAPMLSIPLLITRNGQEVPPGQVRSVQYTFDVHPPKSPQDISTSTLRYATRLDDFYLMGAAFSIYRSRSFFTFTEVKPEFRSLFLRIMFSDGSTTFFSLPVLSDTRENVPMFIDLGSAPR